MRGVTITLYNKVQTGVDAFNRPVYENVATTVDNVLIGEPTTEDVINELNLTGKHLAYTLAIPKGDAHEWNDRKVEFFGEVFHTYGEPTQGIEHLIQLSSNKKGRAARPE